MKINELSEVIRQSVDTNGNKENPPQKGKKWLKLSKDIAALIEQRREINSDDRRNEEVNIKVEELRNDLRKYNKRQRELVIEENVNMKVLSNRGKMTKIKNDKCGRVYEINEIAKQNQSPNQIKCCKRTNVIHSN